MTAPVERLAVLGSGLMGTSIALAAARAGIGVTAWDVADEVAERAAARGRFATGRTLERTVEGADLIVVATPIDAVASVVAQALAIAPQAIVSDVASVKVRVLRDVTDLSDDRDLRRYVPGHPMGGGERSGPDHASASVVDDVVWVVTPGPRTAPRSVATVERFVEGIGAHPVRMSPGRHDRLVAFVSHLPQVASTTLMGLAGTEEADEPEILLLAAGGFRDLTRLAASDPGLWSEILVANADEISRAIEMYARRLLDLRDRINASETRAVRRAFDDAKRARVRLSAKPQVRAGVAVIQVEVADRPGALASLTASLAAATVNIEDLQIVHSPEGGRGTVHLTVAASTADDASSMLTREGYDPVRLA